MGMVRHPDHSSYLIRRTITVHLQIFSSGVKSAEILPGRFIGNHHRIRLRQCTLKIALNYREVEYTEKLIITYEIVLIEDMVIIRVNDIGSTERTESCALLDFGKIFPGLF